MTAVLLAASLAVFAQSKDLALQIALDREGFSCNTIDGSWGEKSDRAFSRWFESNVAGGTPRRGEPAFRSACYREYFASGEPLFRFVRVTASDIASLARIPASASDRSKLASMGYESVKEMMAERGHLSQRALERLNPKVDWSRVKAGDVVKIPHFTSIEEYLASWPRNPSDATYFPEAALVRISLSRCEITAWDSAGGLLATFPCSIPEQVEATPEGCAADSHDDRQPKLHLHAGRRSEESPRPSLRLARRPELSSRSRVDGARPARLRHPRNAESRDNRPSGVAWMLPAFQLERRAAVFHGQARREGDCRELTPRLPSPARTIAGHPTRDICYNSA